MPVVKHVQRRPPHRDSALLARFGDDLGCSSQGAKRDTQFRFTSQSCSPLSCWCAAVRSATSKVGTHAEDNGRFGLLARSQPSTLSSICRC